MVPLDESRTVRDWIAALGLPTLLVGGSYLGAVSHTLSALVALRAAGVEPAAIVVSESADATVSLADGMASLAAHTGGVPMFVVPRPCEAAAIDRIADRLLGRDE
jgi:dethiobiotin synthetase